MEMLYIENTWKFFQIIIRVTKLVINRFAAYILNIISDTGKYNIWLPVTRMMSFECYTFV